MRGGGGGAITTTVHFTRYQRKKKKFCGSILLLKNTHTQREYNQVIILSSIIINFNQRNFTHTHTRTNTFYVNEKHKIK